MDIRMMRGYRQREAQVRAEAVVRGENMNERNGYVLSIAADMFLADSLKARRLKDKHGILSPRQLKRRQRREIYVESGAPEYRPSDGGRRSVRARRANTATSEDMMYDAAH